MNKQIYVIFLEFRFNHRIIHLAKILTFIELKSLEDTGLLFAQCNRKFGYTITEVEYLGNYIRLRDADAFA